MNSHSFVKFAVVIKSGIHMTRMIKSAILSIFQELFAKQHVEKVPNTFWPICKYFTLWYLLDTAYDSVLKVKVKVKNIFTILHQMINQQHLLFPQQKQSMKY